MPRLVPANKYHMRLHEVTYGEHPESRDRFDLDTMSRSKGLLVRKAAGMSTRPEDGYRYGLAIDRLYHLMRNHPDDPSIYDQIESLPGAARAWLMKRVVRRLQDGSANNAHRPPKLD